MSHISFTSVLLFVGHTGPVQAAASHQPPGFSPLKCALAHAGALSRVDQVLAGAGREFRRAAGPDRLQPCKELGSSDHASQSNGL